MAEVNRIAPLLGLQLVAGRHKPKRVPVEGPLTPRGKQPTVVKRVNEGDVPFSAVAVFPRGVRYHLSDAPAFYQSELPFPHALQPGACYTQPRVPPAVGKAAQTPSATVDLEAMRQADAMTLMDMITTLDEEVQEDLYNYMDEMRGPITPP